MREGKNALLEMQAFSSGWCWLQTGTLGRVIDQSMTITTKIFPVHVAWDSSGDSSTCP